MLLVYTKKVYSRIDNFLYQYIIKGQEKLTHMGVLNQSKKIK